tara:strand:+ start:555 stop:692 length:138 start_codon:yes stop_codon:yes gene_type:complete
MLARSQPVDSEDFGETIARQVSGGGCEGSSRAAGAGVLDPYSSLL